MLLEFLDQIPDTRRAQGKTYQLSFMIFFSILAILSGAEGYRGIESFFEIHLKKLKRKFNLKWKKRPAYTTVRNILKGVDEEEFEKAFRDYSKAIASLESSTKTRTIAIDGKVLRHSFDNFEDKKALNILNAFASEAKLVIAHSEVEQKTNEIPAAVALIKELGLSNCIFTLDALHCQKETVKEIKKGAMML